MEHLTPSARRAIYEQCEKENQPFKKYRYWAIVVVCKSHQCLVKMGEQPGCCDLMCCGVCPRAWIGGDCDFRRVKSKMKGVYIFDKHLQEPTPIAP